jgi:hypothetical protein
MTYKNGGILRIEVPLPKRRTHHCAIIKICPYGDGYPNLKIHPKREARRACMDERIEAPKSGACPARADNGIGRQL